MTDHIDRHMPPPETFSSAPTRREFDNMMLALAAAMPLAGGPARSTRAAAANASLSELSDPARLLEAFIKVEGDTSGAEQFTHTYANVYTLFDDRQDRHLFDRERLIARRYQPIDGGWMRLHREVALYRDPLTKDLITEFYNPYLERSVPIIDIHRDFHRPYLVRDVGSSLEIGVMPADDDLFFFRRFFVSRRAEIQPSDYPLHGSDERYELSENHSYIAKTRDVLNSLFPSVPSRGATTSISNWLPWMEMGTAPGKLIHQIRFAKLKSLDDLPNKDFLETVARKYPDHLSAPTTYREEDTRNTGMGWYKEQIDKTLFPAD